MNSSKISASDIEHLAKLSRLRLDPSELASFEKEFGDILAYVSEIQQVKTSTAQSASAPLAHNVMRDDIYVDTRGQHTEKLLKNAPHSEDGYVAVAQMFE